MVRISGSPNAPNYCLASASHIILISSSALLNLHPFPHSDNVLTGPGDTHTIPPPFSPTLPKPPKYCSNLVVEDAVKSQPNLHKIGTQSPHSQSIITLLDSNPGVIILCRHANHPKHWILVEAKPHYSK